MLLGEADTVLTLGGFIALATLVMGAVGLALNASSKTAGLRERVVRLEAEIEAHLANGGRRHERRGEGASDDPERRGGGPPG